MEQTKKKSKIIYILYLLIFIFACLYFTGQTGYYENKISNETKLTREAILEFEQDVAEGKEVDIKDYLGKDETNYENKYSSLGYKISDTISQILTKGINFIVKVMETLFS